MASQAVKAQQPPQSSAGALAGALAHVLRHGETFRIAGPATRGPTLPIAAPSGDPIAATRLPVEVWATFDNQGYSGYGQNEWTVGGAWRNVGGFGQSLSYTFTRSFKGLYSANALTYTAPLPWSDELQISASYTTEANSPGTDHEKTGLSPVVSPRYLHNLRSQDLSDGVALQHDVQIGYDFKKSSDNEDLAFEQAYRTVEVDQFPLIYDATIADPWGRTVLQNILMLSPGGLDGEDSTEAYRRIWQNASARYVYDNINLTRTTSLPRDFAWVLRAQAQLSSGNLPGAEQVCLGGMKSVRGFTPNAYCDSQGVILSNELWTPGFQFGRLTPWTLPAGEQSQIGLFVDYGQVAPHTGVRAQHVALASVGPVLRIQVGRYVGLSFDAGFQLAAAPDAASEALTRSGARTPGVFCDVALTARY